MIAGWSLFVLAVTLSVVKYSQDLVCENTELTRVSIPQTKSSAVVFDRACRGPRDPIIYEKNLLIVVVNQGEKVPSDIPRLSTIWMNKVAFEKIIWLDGKLFVVYQTNGHMKDGEKTPIIRKEFPLPVVLVDKSKPDGRGLFYTPP